LCIQSNIEDFMLQQETMVSTGSSNKCSSYGVRSPRNPQQQQDLSNSCESMHGVAKQVPVAQVVIDRECHMHNRFSTHSASYLLVMFTSLFMNQSTFGQWLMLGWLMLGCNNIWCHLQHYL
jgi:hypothetical protein